MGLSGVLTILEMIQTTKAKEKEKIYIFLVNPQVKSSQNLMRQGRELQEGLTLSLPQEHSSPSKPQLST